MQFDLDTKYVAKCVNFVHKITNRNKKGADPLFTHMQVKIKQGELSFLATDKHYSVIVHYGGIGVQEDLSCMIEVDAIRAITSYASAATLHFDFGEKKVVIKEGKNKYNLKYFLEFTDHSHLFEQYDLTQPLPIKGTSEELNKAIKFLEPCIAQDVARSFLRGIYYDGNFVATDSINCGVYDFGETSDNPFFLVRDGLDFFNAFPSDEIIEVGTIGNIIVVRNSYATYMFPQLAATFPNYKIGVNKWESLLDNEVHLSRLPLQVACSKLLPFTDTYQRQVAKITFMDDEIIINCYHDKKEANEYVAVNATTFKDKEHVVLLDLKALAPLIAGIPGEDITIKFCTNNSIPIKVTNNEGCTTYISKLQRREEPVREEENV